ncbi:hypothetical protein E5554_08395 [Sphingobium sp. PAMC28499]|nr:hypothetical protein E5554_08395 [Sphingobium sp. PAMC28499]
MFMILPGLREEGDAASCRSLFALPAILTVKLFQAGQAVDPHLTDKLPQDTHPLRESCQFFARNFIIARIASLDVCLTK